MLQMSRVCVCVCVCVCVFVNPVKWMVLQDRVDGSFKVALIVCTLNGPI